MLCHGFMRTLFILAVAGGVVAARGQEGAATPENAGTDLAESGVEGAPLHATCAPADRAGTIWIGTEGGGLYAYSPLNNTWKRFKTKEGFGEDVVYALASDGTGRLWVGHLNHGVSVFNGETFRDYSNWAAPHGPLGARVFSMAVSSTDGAVWIATETGLTRYDNKQKKWRSSRCLKNRAC